MTNLQVISGRLLRHLYAWACERLYSELAGSYDRVSWLVSLGRWDRWRALALNYICPTELQIPSSSIRVGQDSHILPRNKGRVLEIGFGTGALLARLAERSDLTVGLELSSAMHQQAAQKLAAQQVSVPRVQARAQALPFADGSFDTVVATFPAPYIVEPATLQECTRVLSRPVEAPRQPSEPAEALCGGRLVIVGLWVSLKSNWWAQVVPFFYGRPTSAWLARLTDQLRAAGFVSTSFEHTDGWARVGIVVAERVNHTDDK